MFYKPIDANSVINVIDEIDVSMIFLVVTFFWVGYRTHLDLILSRRDMELLHQGESKIPILL